MAGREVWTEDVMTDGSLYSTTRRNFRNTLRSSQDSMLTRGSALSQMQKVIRVDSAAESIVELLALQLDEQGTELSTPWPRESGRLILAALWPQVWDAWRVKQNWKGCTELSEDVQRRWEQAKASLKMCRMLERRNIIYLAAQVHGGQQPELRGTTTSAM